MDYWHTKRAQRKIKIRRLFNRDPKSLDSFKKLKEETPGHFSTEHTFRESGTYEVNVELMVRNLKANSHWKLLILVF